MDVDIVIDSRAFCLPFDNPAFLLLVASPNTDLIFLTACDQFPKENAELCHALDEDGSGALHHDI